MLQPMWGVDSRPCILLRVNFIREILQENLSAFVGALQRKGQDHSPCSCQDSLAMVELTHLKYLKC